MSSVKTSAELGNALRIARKQLSLTQPQLALAAGVGVRFIVDLEAGKTTLRLENVLRVIDALGGEVQLIGLPKADPQYHTKHKRNGASIATLHGSVTFYEGPTSTVAEDYPRTAAETFATKLSG